MGIASLTSLAVARNERAPTKADLGLRSAAAEGGADTPPSNLDVLAATVPVGLVAAYTAFIAGVSEIATETPDNPVPDSFLWVRWVGYAVLLIGSAAFCFGSYRAKAQPGARFPSLEIAAVVLSAAAWGLGIPDSPLLASVENGNLGAAIVGLIVFVGIVVNSALANLMKSKAKSARTTAG